MFWHFEWTNRLSTVLIQTTISWYETLHFNFIGITGVAQFLSYIRNKLYQQYNPWSIFLKVSKFYNTYYMDPHRIWTRVHFLWGAYILYHIEDMDPHRISTPLGSNSMHGGPYKIWTCSMFYSEYGPGGPFSICNLSDKIWTTIENGPRGW